MPHSNSAAAILGCLLALLAPAARAQVRTDGSLGAKQSLTGPNFAVPASLGRQVGPNLFHSFSDFNLQSGESATFAGPASVKNVLARVTGGQQSFINGPLRCDIPKANLVLINPAGVVFGIDAALDVKGSFAVTNADYLRLGKSGRFDAAPSKDALLTSAAPTAFGFLTSRKTGVVALGSQLGVGTGKVLSVVSNGDIALAGAALSAPGGRVNLVAAASQGQVGLRPDKVDSFLDSSLTAFADVIAIEGATVQTTGASGGPVSVRAKDFSLAASGIESVTTGTTPGGAIDFRLTGNLALTGGSLVNVSTAGGAPAGSVDVHAENFTMSGGAQITGATFGAAPGGHVSVAAASIFLTGAGTTIANGPAPQATGRGGNVGLRAPKVSITDGAVVAVGTLGAGDGGDLRIRAGDILIRGNGTPQATGLFAGSGGGTTGAGGNISIRTRALRIENAGFISVETAGAGSGGTLGVTADTVSLRDTSTALVADTLQTTGGGPGGSIRMDVGSLSLAGGALILAATTGDGRGGTVSINASSTIDLSGAGTVLFGPTTDPANGGAGARIDLTAKDLTVRDGAAVVVGTLGSGAGGDLRVDVDTLSVTRGGALSADTEGTGAGGSIDVRAARAVLLRGTPSQRTTIQAVTVAPQDGGRAGNVNVTTPSLVVRDQASIASGTTGSGNGGRVTVTADDVLLRDAALIGNTTGPGSTGDGGSINLRAGTLSLTGGSLVSATTAGRGRGGLIAVRAGTISVTDRSVVAASTLGEGKGGSIDVRADDILVRGGAPDTFTGLFAASDEGVTGAAGNIDIRRTGSLRLENRGIISVQTAGAGPAGNLTIQARSVDLDGASFLSALTLAPTGGGPAGNLRLTADRLNVRGGAFIAAGSFGSGNGGVAVIDVGRLVMRGLDTDTPDDSTTFIAAGTNGAGRGGDLTVNADAVRLDNGAAIAVSTGGPGRGGVVRVNARDIHLDRAGIVASSQADQPSDPPPTGDAGSVFVHATKSLSLHNGADVGATATIANGGNITVQAPRIVLRNSEINARAGDTGGSINVTAHTLLYLFRSNVDADGEKRIGNINIDPIFTVLDKSQILTTTQPGAGGNINLQTQRLFMSDDSFITAAQGATVTLNIFVPDTNITGSLVPVNAPLFDSSMTFIEECARRLETDLSSFTITGRGATAFQPGGFAPAFHLQTPIHAGAERREP